MGGRVSTEIQMMDHFDFWLRTPAYGDKRALVSVTAEGLRIHPVSAQTHVTVPWSRVAQLAEDIRRENGGA